MTICLLYHNLAIFSRSPYDLVSHGTNTEGQNECYGDYHTTTDKGWGPGYQYSCIHSGSNEHSGGDTVWYNYAMATAGSIINENTTAENPASNTTPATESVCPKGWTLPNKTQISSIGNNTATYASSFNSVLGGNYYNGALYRVDEFGTWWGSMAPYGTYGSERDFLRYFNSGVLTGSEYANHLGIYIRCVVKKNTKTLSNLTYMQDIAAISGVISCMYVKSVAVFSSLTQRM